MTTKARHNETSVDDFVTTTEAAETLGVTRAYVVMLIARGVLKARKVTSRFWLVNRQSLEGFTRKRKPKGIGKEGRKC
jgi:excisionase family DNA binding protein